MSKQAAPKPPTVITLTLPESDSESRDGTLLIQRGNLAHLNRFTHTRIADLTEIIAEALIALSAVEADPPVITESAPASSVPAKKSTPPPPPAEPTIDIPLKKGKKAVRLSHLKIIGGETDAAAYRQAVLIAGRLIDGKLWDGNSPIRINDVYATMKKMKHLTDKEFGLFTLEHFVQVGAVEPELVEAETEDLPGVDDDGDEPLALAPPHELTHSDNGHHRTTGASDQTALL